MGGFTSQNSGFSRILHQNSGFSRILHQNSGISGYLDQNSGISGYLDQNSGFLPILRVPKTVVFTDFEGPKTVVFPGFTAKTVVFPGFTAKTVVFPVLHQNSGFPGLFGPGPNNEGGLAILCMGEDSPHTPSTPSRLFGPEPNNPILVQNVPKSVILHHFELKVPLFG